MGSYVLNLKEDTLNLSFVMGSPIPVAPCVPFIDLGEKPFWRSPLPNPVKADAGRVEEFVEFELVSLPTRYRSQQRILRKRDIYTIYLVFDKEARSF
jgi:hypothetical protein